MPNVYQVPPGGLTTWRAAQRLMGALPAHRVRTRRPMRGYSRVNPIYNRLRSFHRLGQDDDSGSDNGLLPSYATPLPSDLTPPETAAGGAYVSPSGIVYPTIPTTDQPITSTVSLPAQNAAAASSPYTNVISQIANALANPTGAQQRTILTPTPVSSISSLLGNLPSWLLPAALVVGGVALIGGGKKGRR